MADRDDDSFAYAWSFDDGTFSTNNSPWTFQSWSQPGEHVVRCEVSDMRGGRASANAIVTVGSASGFRVSGRVLDENGDPLEDVLVISGDTQGNELTSGYTDSVGGFVLTGVEWLTDLTAVRYGYTFEPVGWENPLFITTNLIDANLLAGTMTNISLALSTNLLVEDVVSSNQLTLTRTGAVDEDLTVQVYVTGMADVPGDLVFTPPLLSGSNGVVIPAGTNRVVFNFTPVNNGTVEATETVYVTIPDSTNYIVVPLAEGCITILDEDQPTVPEVAVTALAGPVLENGMNSAGFVFHRTGSTGGALPVTYSIGGTATAGADYATLLGTVIIPAGSSSAVVVLQLYDD